MISCGALQFPPEHVGRHHRETCAFAGEQRNAGRGVERHNSVKRPLGQTAEYVHREATGSAPILVRMADFTDLVSEGPSIVESSPSFSTMS